MRSLYVAGAVAAAALTLGASQASAACAQGDTACIRQQVLFNLGSGSGLLSGLDIGNRPGATSVGTGSAATNFNTGSFSNFSGGRSGQVPVNVQNIGSIFNNLNVAIGRLTQIIGNNNTFIQNIIGQIVVNLEVVRG